MLSSHVIVNAEFFSETHRLSCRVSVGPMGLVGLLNDPTKSLIEVEDVYLSRMAAPAAIVTHLERTHVNKTNLTLVLLARREDLGPKGLARGGFTKVLPVPALLTTETFEVRGIVEVVTKFDASELLLGGTGRFLPVYKAAARATHFPDTRFTGAVILVNRSLVGLIAQHSESQD